MQRVFRFIQRIEEFVIAWSILVIALVTVANVVCRALLGFSLAFAEELSRFLIVGVTFVGLSYAASRGRHIRMTAVYDQLSPRWRKVLVVGGSSLTAILVLVLAWYSIEYIATVRFLGTVSPVLRVPLYLVYGLVPLGLVLAAVQYGLTVAKNVTSEGVHLSFEVPDEYEEPVVGEV